MNKYNTHKYLWEESVVTRMFAVNVSRKIGYWVQSLPSYANAYLLHNSMLSNKSLWIEASAKLYNVNN